MRIIALASGSKGNCIAIESKAGNLLIDCGLSLREIASKSREVDFDIKSVRGVLVTHEHFDHVKGLATFSRHSNAPIYIHPTCYKSLVDNSINYVGDNSNYELGFNIGEFNITPFRTPHDSRYSVGYRVELEGKSFALATDLGFVTNGVYNALRGADAVMLESNHDMDMLKNCKYPQYLKSRIMSNIGHLSNEACAETIKKLVLHDTRQFLLAHLSQESNTHTCALSAVKDIEGAVITVASQGSPSREIIL